MKYAFAAAIAAVSLAGAAQAADYTTIVMDIDVAKPADAVWKKVGAYCDLGVWLKVKCELTSGTGDVGTMRRIADRIDEVMVSKTALSYTYTQPTSDILYHGSVEVRPTGASSSKIVYTLFYDTSKMATPEAKEADKARRTTQFKGALANMKALAEAN